jgi:hypothetical protein
MITELASGNGGAQRIQHGRQIDDLLEDGATDRRQPAAERDQHPDALDVVNEIHVNVLAASVPLENEMNVATVR